MFSWPLFLRRAEARSVPWRESVVVGVFCEVLPGLLDSGGGPTGLLGVRGLRFLSPLALVPLVVLRVSRGGALGLRRSEGLRRVRNDWDLALRILGSD